MAVRIIGPIITNIDAVANKRVYDVVFGAIEFSKAVQYTSLQGPFSMGININNTSGYDVYIGVDIQTRETNIVLADRKTLVFCPYNSQITLSGASVPALANIEGEVISVTVHVYRMNFLTSTITNTNISIALFTDLAFIATSPLPYIGIDSIAYDPSEFVSGSTGGFTTAFANTADALLMTFTASTAFPYRRKINSIRLACRPTAFAGDIEVYAQRENVAVGLGELLRIYSKTDEYVTGVYSEPILLRIGDNVRVYATNNNVARDYEVSAVVSGELIY